MTVSPASAELLRSPHFCRAVCELVSGYMSDDTRAELALLFAGIEETNGDLFASRFEAAVKRMSANLYLAQKAAAPSRLGQVDGPENRNSSASTAPIPIHVTGSTVPEELRLDRPPAGGVYRIWTDGACSGNPGPGGWGVFVPDHTLIDEGAAGSGKGGLMLYGDAPGTTNNRMEMLAALWALEITPDEASVEIFTDSQLVVKTMGEGWKRNKNNDIWNLIDRRIQLGRLKATFTWVKGHTNSNMENIMADTLAVKGRDLASSRSTGQVRGGTSQR